MDLLFLHTPKFQNYYKPIGHFSFILYPPVGLLGLADYVRKNGYSARIIHLGVERQKYGAIDIEKILAEDKPKIVGLDLHWHFQSYDVIEIARKIKLASPQTPVLFGGFTASVFAEEILRDFSFVDFVIRGDSETPIVQLLRHLSSGQGYGDVQNLAYRQPSGVTLNPVSYAADTGMLDRICFTDFTMMKDYQTFVGCFSRYMHMPGYSERMQRLLFGRQKAFPVCMGRGCAFDCSFCGGSHEMHSLIGGRSSVEVRSVDAVVASIQDLERFGFDSAGLTHDCIPPAEAEDYYIAIFEELKRLHVNLNITVERYFLPSDRFLQSFRSLGGRSSCITLSPHSSNEELRRKNGFYRYSNKELERCLDKMDSMAIPCDVYFASGLPFETWKDLQDLAAYQRKLRRRYRFLQIRNSMIEIEPGSGMSCTPAQYGLEPKRSTFADYYRYHGEPKHNHCLEMGYARPGCPSQSEVTHFFCRNFCGRFKARFASPLLCRLAAGVRNIGALHAIDKLLSLTAND